jgi:hypothetical protein
MEYHNWFGTNLSKVEKTTSSYPHKVEKEKQTLTIEIQDWKSQYETTKVQLNKPNPILPIRMNNRLKEFEELLLDNTSLKIHNQTLEDKNPKWKEWWQTVQEFTKEHILKSMELAHFDE